MPASVSVIIPAYNAGQRITRAIANVLNQTLPVLEVIVVDDGSTDDTVAVASRFGPPVRVVSKPNGGPASARNLGAGLARGDWLAMLDADDWWFPRKIELQLADAAGDHIGLSHCRLDHRVERPPRELSFQALWDRNWIGNSSVLIPRCLFEALGGFVEDRRLVSVEDYNLWLRVAAAGWRVVTCPHILVHYTQGIGISSSAERLMRASLYNVDDLEQRLGLTETWPRPGESRFGQSSGAWRCLAARAKPRGHCCGKYSATSPISGMAPACSPARCPHRPWL